MRSTPTNIKFYAAIGISITVIIVLLIRFGDTESPKQISLNRLSELEQAITSFMDTNGRPPADLSELGLPDEQLQDHLGEPFKYTVNERSVTVLSYGSDKEAGGNFFKRDFSVTIDLPQQETAR